MSPSVFQAQVTYCISSSNSLPPTQCDAEPSKKKRSSGLLLLRPKSSHGGGRNAILSPESLIKPSSSYPIPPPPPPLPRPDVDDGEESWKKDRYDTQRATLRHTRSIPQLPPLTPPRDPSKRTPSGSGSCSSSNTNRWRRGVLVIHVHGEGGEQGGGLTIYDENNEIIFRYILRPLPELNWSNDDIQIIHHSVYEKSNVLSVHLSGVNRSDESWKKNKGKQPLKSQISTLSKIGRRARGYTITKIDSSSTSATSNSSIRFDEPYINQNEGYTPNTSMASSDQDQSSFSNQILLLDFNNEKEKIEWFTLLRSFGGTSLPRIKRDLSIRILDLQESVPISNLNLNTNTNLGGLEELSNTTSLTNSFDQISARSSEPQITNSASGSVGNRVHSIGHNGKNDWKLGWASKDKLKVEIYTDKQLIGQTTWAQAEDRSEMPFWAELFNFENMREFSSCVLKICRMRSGKTSQPFATVHLPLVSGFMKSKDERYPIVSSSTGQVIGELRMIVAYTVVNIVGMEVYPLPEVFHGMGGTRTIYYMMSKGLLDQCIDLFTRFNWALGTTYNRLVEMSEIEAKASGDTLFRGNTPMTRLLESTMRLVCSDFLRISIGPTVKIILDNEIEVNHENTRSIIKVLDDCWEDMYSQRGTFPNILRQVFAVLFKNVKENHEERKLRYKAISSFLFLRLIGPALMRPHLFGLAKGLPRIPVQKTLTLIAKVFHAMAFFTWNDTARDPELARYSGFIRKNHDTMVDYLSSFAQPLDEFQILPTPPSSIKVFLSTRLPKLLPEIAQGVPTLTVAGPVEVDSDAAVFYELLYQRRKARVGGAEMTREDGVVPGEEEEMKVLIRTMDQFISGVHRKSYEFDGSDIGSSIHSDPRENLPTQTAREKNLRPTTPRPSLQIDVGSAQRDRKLDLEIGLSRVKSNLFERNPNQERGHDQINEIDFARREKQRNVISPNPSTFTSTSNSNSTNTHSHHHGHGHGHGHGGSTWKWLNFGWMSPTFKPPDNDSFTRSQISSHGYSRDDDIQNNHDSISGRMKGKKKDEDEVD